MSKLSMPLPSTERIIPIISDFDIASAHKLSLTGYQGNLTNDSRSIKAGSGDIFCAVIGHEQDGRQYIEQAILSGAKLVLSECENESNHGEIRYVVSAKAEVAVISFYQLNKQLFIIANAYYQYPTKNLTMIGVTGTNGKTSTSQLLGQILTSSQKPCAIIGTNGAGMVDALKALENTTPSATDLVQLFSTFSQQKVTHLAMEVSSHALEQSRITGNVFDIAVFTNLSRDHLDYHGTMANYAKAKKQLFVNNEQQVAVINADDHQAQQWINEWPNKKMLWLYGRSDQVSQNENFVSCKHIKHHSKGVDFVLTTHLGDIDIHSPLLGDFNIDNLLGVIAVLLIERLSLSHIAQEIIKIKAIPGRMEAFSSQDSGTKNSPTAVVDYAHTPDALEKALIACRQHCHGNLFVVFGCGGDRDKGKRPLMAQAAQKYADQLIVTNDNPRTETPMSIINDVLSGLNESCNVNVIVDREEAVLSTLAKAQANDVVLLAGKGHEDYIILGNDKIEYNERQVTHNYFKHLDENALVGAKV
jgi:UDP-N-acetylmuramoyl-L-alanyl-D-glutamate--2,6-diaminopimelate ligase